MTIVAYSAELRRADRIAPEAVEMEKERVILFGQAVVHRLVTAVLRGIAARAVVDQRMQRQIERAVRQEAADQRQPLLAAERPRRRRRRLDERRDEALRPDRVHAIGPRLVEGRRTEAVTDCLGEHVPVVGQVVEDGAEAGVDGLRSTGLTQLGMDPGLVFDHHTERQVQLGGRHRPHVPHEGGRCRRSGSQFSKTGRTAPAQGANCRAGHFDHWAAFSSSTSAARSWAAASTSIRRRHTDP